MTRAIIERLPKFRLIASTAGRNATSIDLKAAEERGVQVVHTGYTSAADNRTDILGARSWAVAPAISSPRTRAARRRMAAVGSATTWPGGRSVVLGLGNIGGPLARIGAAFGMQVIAWSQDLTTERAAEVKATTLVSRDELVPGGGCRLDPSGAQRQDARPRRCAGAGAHEADGAPGQHLARTDRGRGGSGCGA